MIILTFPIQVSTIPSHNFIINLSKMRVLKSDRRWHLFWRCRKSCRCHKKRNSPSFRIWPFHISTLAPLERLISQIILLNTIVIYFILILNDTDISNRKVCCNIWSASTSIHPWQTGFTLNWFEGCFLAHSWMKKRLSVPVKVFTVKIFFHFY